jgi:iron(III) transport system permease protein
MGQIYDSGAMLPIGLAAIFLPLMHGALRIRWSESPDQLLELESLAPPHSIRTFRWIAVPHIAAACLMAGMALFILAMHEIHASVLLAAPGQETMAIRSFTLLHYNPDGQVAAYCLLMMSVMAAGSAAILGSGVLLRAILRKGAPDCAAS